MNKRRSKVRDPVENPLTNFNMTEDDFHISFLVTKKIPHGHWDVFRGTLRDNKHEISFGLHGISVSDTELMEINAVAEIDAKISLLLLSNLQIEEPLNPCQIIRGFRRLTSIKIVQCDLGDSGVSELATILRTLPDLYEITLDSVNATSVGFDSFCRLMSTHQTLTEFRWSLSVLGDPVIFCSFVRSCPSLKFIDLSKYQLPSDWNKELIKLLDDTWRICRLTVDTSDPRLIDICAACDARFVASRKAPFRHLMKYTLPL